MTRSSDRSSNGTREVMVEVDRLTRYYGPVPAINDVSFRAYRGEIVGFLGPNGAGKTTTMKMTAGLLRPNSGRVFVCGADMARDGRAAKQHIAYVPDEPFLYDKLTGREFIHFARDVYGVPRREAEARLERLCARLDMAGFLDQLTETYSHGMRQKVALAAALIHAPRLLIVDEPIVGLDPRTIRVIKNILREIAAEGGTVFMSLHTLDVAEEVADSIGIIHRGRLIALGTLSELRQQASRPGRLEDVFLELTEGPQPSGAGPSAPAEREHARDG